MNDRTTNALAEKLHQYASRSGQLSPIARVWFELTPWPSGVFFGATIFMAVREWNNDV